MKTCIKCGQEKPISAFQPIYGRGAGARPFSQGCRACINALKKEVRRLSRSADRLPLQERFEQYFGNYILNSRKGKGEVK